MCTPKCSLLLGKKVKVSLEQFIMAQRGVEISFSLSLISTLNGSWWSTPLPGRSVPGKEARYALYRRLGGRQGQSGRVRKISLQPGFDSQTVQSVALLLGSHIKSTDIEAETYAEFVCALGLLWRSGGIEEEMQCTCNVSISDDSTVSGI
jgi:hypothetical protein